MNIREVPEEEYQRLARLNQFAQTILSNPEAAPLLEKAAKIVDPSIRTPRLDQQAAVQAPISKIEESLVALNKRFDEEANARAQAETLAAARAKEAEGIAQLRKAGWNDAGIAEIQKVMTEKGIADPLDAAIVFERRYPPPTPTMPGSNGTFNFNEVAHAANTDEDIKALLGTMGKDSNGLEALSNKMIEKTLADIRGGQR